MKCIVVEEGATDNIIHHLLSGYFHLIQNLSASESRQVCWLVWAVIGWPELSVRLAHYTNPTKTREKELNHCHASKINLWQIFQTMWMKYIFFLLDLNLTGFINLRNALWVLQMEHDHNYAKIPDGENNEIPSEEEDLRGSTSHSDLTPITFVVSYHTKTLGGSGPKYSTEHHHLAKLLTDIGRGLG